VYHLSPASPAIKPGLQGHGTGQAVAPGEAGRRVGAAGEGGHFSNKLKRREIIKDLLVTDFSLHIELSLALH